MAEEFDLIVPKGAIIYVNETLITEYKHLIAEESALADKVKKVEKLLGKVA